MHAILKKNLLDNTNRTLNCYIVVSKDFWRDVYIRRFSKRGLHLGCATWLPRNSVDVMEFQSVLYIVGFLVCRIFLHRPYLSSFYLKVGWTWKDGSPSPTLGTGWTGKDGSPSPTLGTIIKKSYNGSSVLSTSLGSKTLNSLGLGGTKI